MPTYKLTYFNGRGRAEVTRYLFAIADVEYEDNRIKREEWPELKKTMPFGQMPVLEVDGVMIAQSVAIARFVAKRLGLSGKDDIQEAIADSYVLAVDDLLKSILQFFLEKDEERKTYNSYNLMDYQAFMADLINNQADDVNFTDEKRKPLDTLLPIATKQAELKRKFKEETAPNTLSKFEAFLSANSSDYFVGNELTWADVVLFHMMSLLRSRALSDEDLSAFPKMLAFESRIKALPRIASWIAKRPESEF